MTAQSKTAVDDDIDFLSSVEEVIEVVRHESGLSFDPRLTKVLLHSEHWRGGLDSSSALALLYEDVSKEAEEAVAAVQPAQTVG